MPDRTPQIEMILRQVESLPTLSPVATRLLRIVSVEDADLDALVELIESDPPLTARLLGLCRRADKGLGDRITTVRRAVVMLGLDAVQAAVLSVSVYDVLGASTARMAEEGPGPGDITLPFDRPGFWKHSIATATASELIAETHVDLGVAPAEAFVAGLLHGLGKLVLELILPRSYGRVLGLAERRQCATSQAELEIIGLDHHTAGKRLGEHWGLPTALRDVMWLYAQPADTLPDLPHKALIGVVGVARTLCRHLHLGWSGEYTHPESLEGPRGLCRRMGLRAELVEAAVSRLHEGVLHRSRVLGLGELTTPELLLQSLAGANRRLGRLAAMLEQRARGAQRQLKVLNAIRDFHAEAGSIRPSRGVNEMLGEVVRSAAAVLGEGFYGAVLQAREGEVWQLVLFEEGGMPTRTEAVEAPGPRGQCASLPALCAGSSASIAALSALPWITDYLTDAPDLRRVQILPLATGAEGASSAWPAAVLLHDRDLGPWGDRTLLSVLTATWASAIVGASNHEGARRLGEKLAASSRTLAEAQEKLAEAQSLARLGELASGAAHEMNNPLTVISGRAQLLAERAGKETDRAAASAIVDASAQLTELISSLRLVADPPQPKIAEVPLGEIVQAAIDLAEARVGRAFRPPAPGTAAPRARARAEAKLDSPAPVLRVDRELLGAALSEIITNGIQASTEAPVVIRAETDARDGRLLIVIEDKGTGMSPRALQHAFDPFFSELPAGRRTGLGLTRARRLVELHNGEVSLQSRPGEGTRATIALPGSCVCSGHPSLPQAGRAPLP